MTQQIIHVTPNTRATEFEQVLMSRDDMTYDEAHQELIDAQERVLSGEDPEEVLWEYGLEPDYIFDLLG